MQRDEVRLECLKLAVLKTVDHKDALLRAEDYFEFVMAPEPVGGGKPLKHAGNTSKPQR